VSAYGGKSIASLTDQQLALAEDDVGNCLLRAYASPDAGIDQKYVTYFESLSALAAAIQVEKEARANV
jgi:hypothetical protein